MIIGHNKILSRLAGIIKTNNLSHAYLFWGPHKVGKRTVANEFIKLIKCQNPNIEGFKPCDKCPDCLEFEKGLHSDICFIDNKKNEISIDSIRGLKRFFSLSARNQHKIALINEADKLSSEASNALLKTLEEPKGKRIIILVSAFPERMPQTILSRVEKIRFSTVPDNELRRYLENFKKKIWKESHSDVSDSVVKISLGRPGILFDFIDGHKNINKEIDKLDKFIGVVCDTKLRWQFIDSASKEAEETIDFLNLWQIILRDALFLKLGIKELSTYSVQADKILKIIDRFSLGSLLKIIKFFGEVKFLLSTTNINPRLAAEVAVLELG